MSARGKYNRRPSKADVHERVTKLEGRLDALTSAFAELTARMQKVEVAVAGPKDPEPPPPFR